MLDSEKKAIALFERMGREEVERRLDELSGAAEERYRVADHIPNGWTVIDFMTSDEREERHLLVMSLSLCTNPREEARKRIESRLKQRRGTTK